MRLFYVKTLEKKKEIIEQKKKEYNHIVYLLPKKFYDELKGSLENVEVHFYEDISKSNDLINYAREESLLILDSPARYKNIGTSKFSRLSKISKQYKNKIIIDSVPFASEIEFLYVPLSYIDRNILGYQHHYSFRENNSEVYQGKQWRSHDFELNAKKMSGIAYQEYQSFLDGIEIKTHEVALTQEEKDGYEKKKEDCFKKYDRFNPIVTALSDYSNMRESVYEKIGEVLQNINGEAVLYTNIKTHNKYLKKRFPNVNVRTFYDVNGDEQNYKNIILCEVPIARAYLFTDVLSRLNVETTVHIIKPNVPAIKLLYNRMNTEYTQLDEFTKILRREINCVEKRS